MDCTGNGPFLGNGHLGEFAGAAGDITTEKVEEESAERQEDSGCSFSHEEWKDKVVML